MNKLLLSVILIILGTACAITPAGYTKAQFDALPPEKRTELIEKDRAERRARWAQKNAELAQKEQNEEAEAAKIRANPKYGDVVIITAESGYVLSSGRPLPITPASFEVFRGSSKEISFQTPKGFVTLGAKLFLHCDTLHLSEYESCPNTGIDRNQPVWAQGMRYQPKERVKADSNIKDLVLFVRYKDLPR